MNDAAERAVSGVIRVHVLEMAGVGTDCVDSYRTLLDKGERARAERFVRAGNRDAFILAHGLVRTSLSELAAQCGIECSPAAWRIAVDGAGKPFVLPIASGFKPDFSLSHTDGAVAVAVSTAGPVGVDVERRSGRGSELEALARRCLAAEEYGEFVRLCGDESIRLGEACAWDRFIRYWTAKEAYVKAIGTGLSKPLDSFAITLNSEPALVRDLERGIDGWRFALRETDCHALALAHGASTGVEPEWFLRQMPGKTARTPFTL